MNKEHELQQEIWTKRLLDEQLRCTCDEVIREKKWFQAMGHYHHCMLYQVGKAIQRTIDILDDKNLIKKETIRYSSHD